MRKSKEEIDGYIEKMVGLVPVVMGFVKDKIVYDSYVDDNLGCRIGFVKRIRAYYDDGEYMGKVVREEI